LREKKNKENLIDPVKFKVTEEASISLNKKKLGRWDMELKGGLGNSSWKMKTRKDNRSVVEAKVQCHCFSQSVYLG